MNEPTLQVPRFLADLQFGHLTVFLGRNVREHHHIMRWLKYALDAEHLLAYRGEFGWAGTTLEDMLGQSFAGAEQEQVYFNGTEIGKLPGGGKRERCCYIPASRAQLLLGGYPQDPRTLVEVWEFPQLEALFTSKLCDFLEGRTGNLLHGVNYLYKGTLEEIQRRALDSDGILSDGTELVLRPKTFPRTKELRASAWSPAQQQFVPLLLGVMAAFHDDLKPWVVIEQPELGLDPEAVAAFMLLVLDLLARDVRVVLSTQSTDIVGYLWTLPRLQKRKHAKAEHVLCALGLDNDKEKSFEHHVRAVFQADIKTYTVTYPSPKEPMTFNLHNLDVASEDPLEASWAGLTHVVEMQTSAVVRAGEAEDT